MTTTAAGTAREGMTMTDETTRLRALLERAALPACEAAYDEDTGVWTVYPLPREQGVTVAEVAWSQAFCENGLTAARAQLFAAIPTALPGLLDAAERAEREHREAGESTRAAWRESERREQELRDRLIAAERERDDLAATLETRTAEHALAMARAREMEAIIAGRSKPPTNAELVAMESAGLRLARRWHAVDKAGNVRAWPTAEVSR